MPLMMMLLLMLLMVMMGVVRMEMAPGHNTNQTEAEEFLALYNRDAQVVSYRLMEAYWKFETNITVENQQAAVDEELRTDLWVQNMSRKAAVFNVTGFPAYIRRQLAIIQDIGTAALRNKSKLEKLGKTRADMESIYSTAKVCLEDNNCLPLEPEITSIMESSRDEKLLRRLWSGWRDQTGKKMRQLYSQFVDISNEAARLDGYPDTGAYWRSWYQTESFEQDVAAFFRELEPFYLQLHAFVRRRLRTYYGENVFPSSGHIPAHLLGNMWAQQWSSLQDLLMPYPEKPILDVTDQMLQQGYTARKIFEVADNFFTSLGLEPMNQEFWNKSMLEKPTDGRDVVCHASAWDFGNGKDFRVKQCTRVTMADFSTAHHEMGHIVYCMLYRHQPVVFRSGANPGFHEAVGDTISLSVETPKHLHQIGLLPTLLNDSEADLNFLMAMALQKIAFLPFGYLVDQWRWSVFRGNTTPENYNQAWWDLRCNLQGVSPPVERTEEDFDPGAKYHIPANVPYIRYFVSFVIQFQFQKALCEAAGHQGPLHTCDIYNSTQAGEKLRAMLSTGRSEVWTKPFQNMTGTTKMSAQPLIQYFQPLMDHLQRVNRENGEDPGWTRGCPPVPISSARRLCGSSLLLLILVVLVTRWLGFEK